MPDYAEQSCGRCKQAAPGAATARMQDRAHEVRGFRDIHFYEGLNRPIPSGSGSSSGPCRFQGEPSRKRIGREKTVSQGGGSRTGK